MPPAVWLLVALALALLIIALLLLRRFTTDDGPDQPGAQQLACPEDLDPDDDPFLLDTVAATIAGEPLRVRGCNLPDANTFSASLNGGAVSVEQGTSEELTLALPGDARSGELQLATDGSGAGAGAEIALALPVEVYDYETVQLPPTPGTAARALAITVDSAGTVWVNQEFHRSLHRVTGSEVEAFKIPIPESPPFATTLFGDRLTATSTLGEDIIIGPEGGVWFTEGGASLYTGDFANRSRILRFDPVTEAFDVYTVPGEGNEVIGLTFDDRGTAWFAQGGLEQAAIVNFDPNAVPSSNTLPDPANPGWCTDVAGGCFRPYFLDQVDRHPAHLIVIDDAIWFTEFFGAALSRLEIDTGAIERFPFTRSRTARGPTVGAGPWQLYLDETSGDIVVNEYFDNRVIHFDLARADGRPEQCRRTNNGNGNRCASRIEVAGDLESVHIHSIAAGRSDRVWFTMTPAEDAPTSVGFLMNRNEVHLLPVLSEVDPAGGGGQAGIAIDPQTGDIVFAEFFNNSIGRLILR